MPVSTADAELEALKQQLGTLAAPEQFYGENHLRLHHEPSGATLRWAGGWANFCEGGWAVGKRAEAGAGHHGVAAAEASEETS